MVKHTRQNLESAQINNPCPQKSKGVLFGIPSILVRMGFGKIGVLSKNHRRRYEQSKNKTSIHTTKKAELQLKFGFVICKLKII